MSRGQKHAGIGQNYIDISILLSSLSSFRSGLCTNDSKILMHPCKESGSEGKEGRRREEVRRVVAKGRKDGGERRKGEW